MIRRIEIENFMSHGRTIIEPAEGLTVLAGPNNCGKSVVVIALQTLCNNARGDYMVRHGEDECRVAVETEEGHVVEWQRKSGSVSYTINGEDIHRVGGGVPDNLHELLRLPKVEGPDGTDQFDIHFAEQKAPIFLLDASGRHAAMFFASSSDAALLMEMQRRHKHRVSDSKREERELAEREELLDRFLESLAPVKDIDTRLKGAEKEYESIQQAAGITEKLAGELDALKRSQQTTLRARALCAALTDLSGPPSLLDTEALASIHDQLERKERDVSAVGNKLEALSQLANPPEMSPTEPLETLCEALTICWRRVKRLETAVQCLDTLNGPPDQHDTDRAEERFGELDDAEYAVAAAHARLSVLSNLRLPPDLDDTEPLATLIENVLTAEKAVRSHELKISSANQGLAAVEGKIRKWAEVNRTCPTCGAELDADRLIASGGIHCHAEE